MNGQTPPADGEPRDLGAETSAFPDKPVGAAVIECRKTEELTWIAIKLLDEQSRPVPHASYRITFPDGRVETDRLNAHGFAYHGRLKPGLCKVEFPVYSPLGLELPPFEQYVPTSALMPGEAAPATSPPAPSAGASPTTATTFIGIQLEDEAGEPIPRRKYRLTLPNGGEIDGMLDEYGYAYVDGIEPGACKVSFPDIDSDFITEV